MGFDTDVNGAALAEGRWGAARGLEDFAYVTVGTGIGVGTIVRGRSVFGMNHTELGHIRVARKPGDKFPGVCPFHGDCIEGLASGPAIEARAGMPASQLPPDHPAWDFVAHGLGQLMHTMVLTTAPSRIFLGGGVMSGQTHLFERIQQELKRSLNRYVEAPELEAGPRTIPRAAGSRHDGRAVGRAGARGRRRKPGQGDRTRRDCRIAMTERSGKHMRLSGTNLERAGDHNQRVTLHAIRVNGPITRAELAVITGLTAPAIANITKRLLTDNLIQDAGRRRGGRGQPATKLVINPDSWFSIGLNIDRDHITMVVLDFEGRVRARASREVNFAMPKDVQQFFAKGVDKLLAKVGIGRDRLVGVGVALPDDMPRAALPQQPANYGIWASTDVASLLRETLHVPVFVENDAAAATMGEMQFGLGKKYQTFFYILITAALGGSLVIDGNHFRGATGRSGELGMLRGRDATGHERQIQNIVSLSALYSRLAAQGIKVSAPHELTRSR